MTTEKRIKIQKFYDKYLKGCDKNLECFLIDKNCPKCDYPEMKSVIDLIKNKVVVLECCNLKCDFIQEE